ncbi:hypothetical protein [Marixanthomonas ophiurae]|uniref:Uncharacterized protein n=1 Tax=Marixanthomonas ophiurae TaxID=387659 RepID=A0A3E1Q8F7_9FLAO|nr:hypothetical protein [Marixanthomonas ophiurae]RFN58419.1 hypothetical protein DZ858_14460 [Marixanthomonas ophiurae]
MEAEKPKDKKESDLINKGNDSEIAEQDKMESHHTQGKSPIIKSFIEMCGRHPFATGLFAILGLIGLIFSIYGFLVDRSESISTTKQIDLVVDSISQKIVESNPVTRDRTLKNPIKLDLRGDHDNKYIDNIVFPDSQNVIMKELTLSEAKSLMHNIIYSQNYSTYDPFYGFSVSSISNKGFVQIAPYLLIDVTKVTSINEDLAGFYFGERGGGAILREFKANIFPKEGIQVAPMINATKGKYVNSIDYISLMPGEVEEFMLYLDFYPGFYYDLRIGLQIKFNGINSVIWDTNSFHRGVPSTKMPIYDFTSTKFNVKYHPDAEGFADYTDNFLERIHSDIDAYNSSRVFNMKMADLAGPVSPTQF